jgi:hypothetical protein
MSSANPKPSQSGNVSSAPSNKSKGNLNSFLYGAFSGFVCGLLYQPLEVLKINMIILPEDLFTNRVMRNSTYYG